MMAKILKVLLVLLTIALVGCSSKIQPTEPRILVILAHPDDETWMNGTIAKYKRQGAEIHLIYATSGERGSDRSGKNLKGYDLAKQREQEAINALSVLGVTDKITFLRLQDGKLRHRRYQLVQAIKAQILNINPDKIFTFGPGGVTGHSDHIALNQTMSDVYKQLKLNNKLMYIAISQRRAAVFLKAAAKFKMTKYAPQEIVETQCVITIDVSEQTNQRIKSPKAHQTQFPKAIIDSWQEFVMNSDYEEFTLVDSCT